MAILWLAIGFAVGVGLTGLFNRFNREDYEEGYADGFDNGYAAAERKLKRPAAAERRKQ